MKWSDVKAEDREIAVRALEDGKARNLAAASGAWLDTDKRWYRRRARVLHAAMKFLAVPTRKPAKGKP